MFFFIIPLAFLSAPLPALFLEEEDQEPRRAFAATDRFGNGPDRERIPLGNGHNFNPTFH